MSILVARRVVNNAAGDLKIKNESSHLAISSHILLEMQTFLNCPKNDNVVSGLLSSNL